MSLSCWLVLGMAAMAMLGCRDQGKGKPEISEIRNEVDTLLTHARTMLPEGNYGEILDALDVALNLCVSHLPKNDTLLADIYYFIGNVHRRAGHIGRSLQAYRQGWNVAKHELQEGDVKLRDSQRYAMALANQFSRQMMVDSALYYGALAGVSTRSLEGDSSRMYSRVLQNAAVYAMTAHKYDTAIGLNMAALKVMRKVGDDMDIAVAEINLAEALFCKDDSKSSARYFQRALTRVHWDDPNASYYRATALTGIARCLAHSDPAATALTQQHYLDAIALMVADTLHPQPRELAKMRLEYGRWLAKTGRHPEALSMLQAAMQDFYPGWQPATVYSHPPLHILEREPYAFEVLSAQAASLGALATPPDLDSAFATYRHAFRFADQIRRGFASVDEKLGLMRLTYPEYDRAIDLALAQAGTRPESSHSQLAFEWIERSKANDLLDQLLDLERYQIDLLPDWAVDSGRALESRILQAEAAAADGDTLATQALQRLQARKGKLVAALRQWHPGYFYQEPPFADVEAVRCSLPNSDAVFVSYFLGRDHVHVSAVSVGGDTSFVVPDARHVMQLASRLMKWIRDGNDIGFHAYDSVAEALHAQLLAPVYHMRGLDGGIPNRMVIAPDGGLAFLPFEALVTERLPPGARQDWAAPAYLVRRSVISYVQSGSIFAAAAPVRDKPKRGVFGMGMGYEQSGLYNAVGEVEQAVELLTGEAVTDEAATESRLKLAGTVWEILHLSAHGMMDALHPLQGFIQLLPDAPAEDGRLHFHEVLRLRLVQRLAVLSACHTGDGASIPGLGVLSMGLAFQIAGCPSVIQSLSSVDDEATARMMRYFYEGLAADRPISEALTSAKRAMLSLASSKQAGVNHHYLQHPFYWALFVLVGNGEQLQ